MRCRSRSLPLVAALVAGASSVSAQAAAGPPASPRPTAEQQIAVAVLPAPEPLRAGAEVRGYDATGRLVTLRPGSNGLICLADDPAANNFHVACYQKELDPFMARGRELKALKASRETIDSVRGAEIAAGKLTMPPQPTALYELFGPEGSWNPETNEVKGAQAVYVIYIPYATEAMTGMAQQGHKGGMPWLMFPGKPWAHVMITP
ncbi:MAG: hypothetical protein ACOY71_14515 [Gemmatimonadota bacterium]